MGRLQEHDSSVEYNMCAEQESLPEQDQKQSKINDMSLVGRDVIGLVKHTLKQPTLTKFQCVHSVKNAFKHLLLYLTRSSRPSSHKDML